MVSWMKAVEPSCAWFSRSQELSSCSSHIAVIGEFELGAFYECLIKGTQWCLLDCFHPFAIHSIEYCFHSKTVVTVSLINSIGSTELVVSWETDLIYWILLMTLAFLIGFKMTLLMVCCWSMACCLPLGFGIYSCSILESLELWSHSMILLLVSMTEFESWVVSTSLDCLLFPLSPHWK